MHFNKYLYTSYLDPLLDLLWWRRQEKEENWEESCGLTLGDQNHIENFAYMIYKNSKISIIKFEHLPYKFFISCVVN